MRRLYRILFVVLLLALALAAVAALTTAKTLTAPTTRFVLDTDLSALPAKIDADEAGVAHLIPGAGKRIVWADEPGARTNYVVIYLHGFSASRQEIAPVPERVAKVLGANLFETRLTGHGLDRGALAGTTAEEWLSDGSEALAIGRALGDRLVLMGTSTGATLAVALARHPDFPAVEALVLMSPNFGVPGERSDLPSGPFGKLLTRLVLGKYNEWEPANEQQARYWSTRYPSAVVVEMIRLVDLARILAPEVTTPKALLIYSPDDEVVSVPKLLDRFDALDVQYTQVHTVTAGGGPSNHVLAGDILAPENTHKTVEQVCTFVYAGCQPGG